jgi:ribosome-binding factor A
MLFKKFTFTGQGCYEQTGWEDTKDVNLSASNHIIIWIMDSVRQNKIARLIQKELAVLFQAEGRELFPGRMITVTMVRVTPDLALAKVYLSVFPHNKDEDIVAQVKPHSRHFRSVLGQNIRHQVRVIPELVFYLDDSMDYFERIDKLLKS